MWFSLDNEQLLSTTLALRTLRWAFEKIMKEFFLYFSALLPKSKVTCRLYLIGKKWEYQRIENWQEQRITFWQRKTNSLLQNCKSNSSNYFDLHVLSINKSGTPQQTTLTYRSSLCLCTSWIKQIIYLICGFRMPVTG